MLTKLKLSNILTKNNKINNNNSKIFKKQPELMLELYNATSFLSPDANTTERIYALLNNTKEQPVCNTCTKDVRYKSEIKSYPLYCSAKCSANSISTKNKRNNTNVKIYGNIHPSKSQDVRAKISRSHLNRTHDEKESALSKKEKTCMERYGVTNPMLCEHIVAKREETCLERYGVPVASQSVLVREKIRNNHHRSLNIYNTPAYDYLSDSNWLFAQYVDLEKSALMIAEELKVAVSTVCIYLHHYDLPIHRIGKFSQKAICWLNNIAEKEGIYIQHAMNEGEFKIPNYNLYADGFCAETNTIYEFHGDVWHGNLKVFKPEDKCHPFNSEITAQELFDKTIEREQIIRDLGYNVVIKWETD